MLLKANEHKQLPNKGNIFYSTNNVSNKKIFLTDSSNSCLMYRQHNFKVHKSQLGKQSNKAYKYKDGKQ